MLRLSIRMSVFFVALLLSSSIFARGSNRSQIASLEKEIPKLEAKGKELEEELKLKRARLAQLQEEERKRLEEKVGKLASAQDIQNQRKELDDLKAQIAKLAEAEKKHAEDLKKTQESLKSERVAGRLNLTADEIKAMAKEVTTKDDAAAIKLIEDVQAKFKNMDLLAKVDSLKFDSATRAQQLQAMNMMIDQTVIGQYVASRVVGSFNSKDFCTAVKSAMGSDGACAADPKKYNFGKGLLKSGNTQGVFNLEEVKADSGGHAPAPAAPAAASAPAPTK